MGLAEPQPRWVYNRRCDAMADQLISWPSWLITDQLISHRWHNISNRDLTGLSAINRLE